MIDRLKEYTILYVEDDKRVQELMSEYLKNFFKDVYVASDGQEALEVYRRFRPQALLLDIDLPKLSGIEIAKEIRQEDLKVSIIILTAYTNKEFLLQATQLKLLTYLVKPIDLKDFHEILIKLAQELERNFSDRVYFCAQCYYDKESLKLFRNGVEVHLSSKEKVALSLLIKNKNRCVCFEELMAYIWEDNLDKEVSINSLKNIISSLRKKLPEATIENVYAKGYMLS